MVLQQQFDSKYILNMKVLQKFQTIGNIFIKFHKFLLQREKIIINKVGNTYHEYVDISTHFHYETNLFVFDDDEDNQLSDFHVQPSDNVSNEKNEKGKKFHEKE